MYDPSTYLNIRQETLIDKDFPCLFLFVIWIMELYDTCEVFCEILTVNCVGWKRVTVNKFVCDMSEGFDWRNLIVIMIVRPTRKFHIKWTIIYMFYSIISRKEKFRESVSMNGRIILKQILQIN